MWRLVFGQAMDRAGRAAYRTLWRAQRDVFVSDALAQAEAKKRMRVAFRSAKVTTDKEREQQVRVALDTAQLLRQTVVQAKFNPATSHYKAKFGKQHLTTKAEADTELI